jgi:ureidoacrylate peracid hydrolase
MPPWPTSREIPVVPADAALLFIDVQNYCAVREGGEFSHHKPEDFAAKLGYFFDEIEQRIVPNMQRLQAACRSAGIEVMYTVIQSLTRDGRDRSLDYKITGFNVPPGSWDARVIDAIAPGPDEMVIPKTSSILRNLGVRQLVISGIVTDQCISSAVRDACDLGYLVTVVTDACATYTRERHEAALAEISGYCRQRTTNEFLAEITPA